MIIDSNLFSMTTDPDRVVNHRFQINCLCTLDNLRTLYNLHRQCFTQSYITKMYTLRDFTFLDTFLVCPYRIPLSRLQVYLPNLHFDIYPLTRSDRTTDLWQGYMAPFSDVLYEYHPPISVLRLKSYNVLRGSSVVKSPDMMMPPTDIPCVSSEFPCIVDPPSDIPQTPIAPEDIVQEPLCSRPYDDTPMTYDDNYADDEDIY